jgi:hypothetical protein
MRRCKVLLERLSSGQWREDKVVQRNGRKEERCGRLRFRVLFSSEARVKSSHPCQTQSIAIHNRFAGQERCRVRAKARNGSGSDLQHV